MKANVHKLLAEFNQRCHRESQARRVEFLRRAGDAQSDRQTKRALYWLQRAKNIKT